MGQAKAATDRKGHPLPLEMQGRDRLTQAPGDVSGVIARTPPQDEHEFVTAQAANHILRPYAQRDQAGHLAQQGIPGGMAGNIVDELEMIEVDETQGYLIRAAPGNGENLVQSPLKGAPVVQSGQGIMQSFEGEVAGALRDLCLHHALSITQGAGELVDAALQRLQLAAARIDGHPGLRVARGQALDHPGQPPKGRFQRPGQAQSPPAAEGEPGQHDHRKLHPQALACFGSGCPSCLLTFCELMDQASRAIRCLNDCTRTD